VSDFDGDVVRAVKRGDRDAFARLIQAYQGRLFGLVLMVVRDRALAEEVTQDAFVRAFTHLGMYDEGRPFYPWVATIAVRLAQNQLVARARVARREGTPLDEAPDPQASTGGPAALIEAEQRRAVWTEVTSLPAGERIAVVLYYRDDVSVRDIAHTLGVTAGTVKTWLFRARRRLRERLQSVALQSERVR
jgi:RNA polymerase sigma-70 factor (ECF subfamily)